MGNDELSFLLSTNPNRQEPAPATFEAALQTAALCAERLAKVLRCPRTGRPGLPPGDPERIRLERLHRDACELAAELCPYDPAAAPEPTALAPNMAPAPAVDPADAAEAARRRAAREVRKKKHLPDGDGP